MIDLGLDDEQSMLVETASRLLGRHCTTDDVRKAERDPLGFDRSTWDLGVDAGWNGLVVHEEHGGTGMGIVEVVLLAELFGRFAYSSPLVGSLPVALALSWCGSPGQKERFLPGIAAGTEVVSLAALDPGARDEWSAPTLHAERHGDRWGLSGCKRLVPWADVATLFATVADVEGRGPSIVLVRRDSAELELRRRTTLGPEPLYDLRIELEICTDDILGGTDLVERLLQHAATTAVAYAAGLGEKALELSVGHASRREQFGRPIGSFQAVAHRCADMRADVDAVVLLAYQAACRLEVSGRADLEVAAAQAFATDALRRIFVHAHQIHGAIGFSIDHDLQLFTRRAKAFELSFGSADRHREKVAGFLGLQGD